MSSTDPTLDSLSASLASQWKPNETRFGGEDKPGTGKAVQNTGLLTPEGTPEVDDGRIEAEKRRQAELEETEAAKKSDENQPPKNQEPPKTPTKTDDRKTNDSKTDDHETNEEAVNRAQVLKEVLSCGQDEYHKILGIKEDYDNGTEEMRSIETAVYNRGVEVHPRYNKDGNAEQAWNSK
jgi:hypothetical protein